MNRLGKQRLALAAAAVVLASCIAGASFAQDHAGGKAPRRFAPVPGQRMGDHAVPPAMSAGDHGAAAPAAPDHGAGAAAEHGASEAAGEHGEGAAHGEHGGHHGPEPINWTNIWDPKRPAFIALVINFGVLMALYYMLGKKPVTEALKQRRVTIGKDIDEAQKLLDEAKERAKKYQGNLKNADADAATTKTSLVASGKGEVERILLDAQERAERMKRDADRLVDQERKQVHQDLLLETVDLAVTEATELLAKSATADDHERLAHDLLLELARRPAAKAPAARGTT